MASKSVHNANYLRVAITSHKDKVKSLYKRALRDLYAHTQERTLNVAEWRYEAILLRQRFEANRGIKDLRVAKLLLEQGEQELWLGQHPKPVKFPYSPGGICYERYFEYPDGLLDAWHPMEKAQYPHYFARREQRKQEYVRQWEAKYGRPAAHDLGVHEHNRFYDEPATEEEKKYGPFTKPIEKLPPQIEDKETHKH